MHALSFDPRANQNVLASLNNLSDFYQTQLEDFDKQLFDVNPDDFGSIKQKSVKQSGTSVKKQGKIPRTTYGILELNSMLPPVLLLDLTPTVINFISDLEQKANPIK